MQIEGSLIDPFRVDGEQTRLIYTLENFHPYAARFPERWIDHAQQFFTKGIDIHWLWIEIDNEMERQQPSSKTDSSPEASTLAHLSGGQIMV
jgi:hypothetical protein